MVILYHEIKLKSSDLEHFTLFYPIILTQSDASAVSNIITKQLLNSIVDILKLVVVGILIFRISIPLALIILLLFPISSVVYVIFGKKLKKESASAAKLWDKYYSQIQESLFCIKEIKSLGIKDIRLNNFLSLSKKIKEKSIGINTISTISQSINQIVTLLSNITTLGAGTYLIFKNMLSIEQFMVFNSYSMQFRLSLNSITKLNSNVQESLVSLSRVFELTDDLVNSKEKFGSSEISEINGQITFENVSFSYPSGKLALNLVSFKIPKNKVVSIVGRSGCGKTTIFNLLQKFYLPTEGKITIDTFDLNDFSEKSLRSNVSIVRQEPVLFNMSIKENLLLANPYVTEQQIFDACQKAYIHDYIMSLPDKYESIVGEISSNLSGGQIQRIAIARTILKNSKIILFDEATSSLDNESQYYIKKAIYELSKNHTIVIIAHRLLTIIDADEIIIIDNGKVVGKGTHKELIRFNTIYKDLYELEIQAIRDSEEAESASSG